MSTDWKSDLRQRGYRLTPQRQLVLEAVDTLEHATPDDILIEVRKTASGVNISTVYRTLELLEELGLVSHAHLGHGAPTYHLADRHHHIHLVCRDCTNVIEADISVAARVHREAPGHVRVRDGHEALRDLRPLRDCAGRRRPWTEAGGRVQSECRNSGRRLVDMKSPLLSLPGAVPAEGVDEGVAAHYGDLFREQRALADGTGFVDLSHRGVIAVTGADRLSWLHLLLTQHVSDLPAGRATEALILSAHGHIEHALYLVDDGTTTWAHVEPGTQGD